MTASVSKLSATRSPIAAAAKRGDQVATLQAMRDRVATAVDDPKTPARELASLTKRLADIMREIEGLQAPQAEQERRSRTKPDAFDVTAI